MAVIALQDVRRRFGRVHALAGLTLEAREGEIYGFLGRNGAGKTTTLLILMGILRPDGGEVRLFGEAVRRVGVAQKRRIGYVSQEQTFYPWMTARQLSRFVAGFYPRWDAAEFDRLLRLLDVPADRRAAELSGGTRAKLGLALALAPRPDLVLLDEPTAGLDPVARREFLDLLQALVRERGVTALFSSHLVGEVEQAASRVGIVQAGRMRFEGEIPALLASLRRLPGFAGPLPPGFEPLAGGVARADPERWAAAAWPEGVSPAPVDLEEAFLAFARVGAEPA